MEEICDELSGWLNDDGKAEYITLAGSGEPTLYSRFGDLVDFIHSETDIPVLILSNGSMFWRPEVREAAAKADVVKLSMSVWNQQMFNMVNRPAIGVNFNLMIHGEEKFREEYDGKIVLEVFLLGGINAIKADVARIAERAARIRPDAIHLNTVTRPAAEDFAFAVSKEKMEEFAEMFTPKAEIPPEVSGSPILNGEVDDAKILDLIRRRPTTLRQLGDTFGIHPNEVAKITGKLIREGRLRMESGNGNNHLTIA